MMLRRGREAEAAARLRVEVAPGLQLLFSDFLLAGWILEDPEYRIRPVPVFRRKVRMTRSWGAS